jgi:hypothetical protein
MSSMGRKPRSTTCLAHDHQSSYSPMCGPCPAPLIGFDHQEHADHALAPPPVSPRAPLDLSPVGLGEPCIPPASG